MCGLTSRQMQHWRAEIEPFHCHLSNDLAQSQPFNSIWWLAMSHVIRWTIAHKKSTVTMNYPMQGIWASQG